MKEPAAVEVRKAMPSDGEAILALLRTSLPAADDDRYPGFIEWKHKDNPFGPSPDWVASVGTRIVGYRSFMRWEFEAEDSTVVSAVRAVDTVTDPEFRNQGIFARLTMTAVADLTAEGTAFVFNMPNSRSGPGYEKMGWVPVAHPRVFLRPRLSPKSLRRLLSARGPSERWSVGTSSGISASDFLGRPGLDELLGSRSVGSGLRTRLTPAYLRWRYGLGLLDYRCVGHGDSPADGFAIFRLHRRGHATEAVVCEVLVPGDDARRAARLLRKVAAVKGADHALALGQPGLGLTGFVPFPGRMPTLMWRPLCRSEAPDWSLTMGDLEIF